MKKRLLSLLLTLVMILGMIPATTLTANAVGLYMKISGVDLSAGEYLEQGSRTPTTTKPADNYAYFDGTTLELHNYTDNVTIQGINGCWIRLFGYNKVERVQSGFFNLNSTRDLTISGNGTPCLDAIDYPGITATSLSLESGNLDIISTYGAFYRIEKVTYPAHAIALGFDAETGTWEPFDLDKVKPDYYKHVMIISGAYFGPQSPAMPAGKTEHDLGKVSSSEYVMTFASQDMPSSLSASGCKVIEQLVVYDRDNNGKIVDTVTNNPAINGTGISYSLKNLPSGNYRIRESITLYDKDGKALYGNNNDFILEVENTVNNINVRATFSGTPAKATTSSTGATVTATKWYKKNGSAWTQLSASDTIKEGNTYRCEVTVGATGIYTLADGYTVKINGIAATKKSGNTWYRDVTSNGYTSYLDVYDIALPETGVYPDFTYNDVECRNSSVALVEWFECDKDGHILSGALTENYVFQKDTYYRVEVTVVPETNWQFHGSDLDFYINDKAAMPLYGYNKAYPNSVTGYVVYHVDDANGTYTVKIGDVTLKDGDYLANNVTTVTTVKPVGGYAYYKDGVLTLNNFVAAKLVRYYERYLEVELIGENKIGAIADYYYWDGNASNNYYTGLEFRGTGNLEFDEYYDHPYCNVSVNGDVIFNGSGDILLDAEICCFQYTDNVIINDGYVYCYCSQFCVFGDDTNITVNGGKLKMLDGGSWNDYFICSGDLLIYAGSVYVSADPHKIELEDCVPWDGVTDLETYDCVWIVEEQATVTHTVTFKVDTTTVATKTVEDGKTVTAPADPVKDGYKFLGWYTDGGTKFDFSTPIPEDITLTAKFEDAVYVGGVGMYDGDYLAVGATATQTTKPSGGYAYYKNGTLTLNNYSYEGEGYKYDSRDYYATVYAEQDLTLELVGNNTLKQTKTYSEVINVYIGNLTIQGDGSLNATAPYDSIYASKTITVSGGTIISTGSFCGMRSYDQDIIINGGTVTVSGYYGLMSKAGSVKINGGNVTATGSAKAISYGTDNGENGSFTVAEGLYIQASTTEDGALGAYVAENHDSYKKIVITPPDVYVGGVGMCDGDYLAVGATATQTTKPSGGYAYYKDGTLTLNNYSYEGKGYQYHSGYADYAVIYSKIDLTLELIGNNTLTQTGSYSDMIYVDGANLTVGGDGKLTGTAGGFGLCADKDITINGGTVEVSTYLTSINSNGGEVIINDGDITAETEAGAGIYSEYDVTVNGGNVTAIGTSLAIFYGYYYNFSVAEGMKIQASTTVDGTLGEYVAANHDSYKKIVITPAITLTGSATDGIKVMVEKLSGSATLIVAQYEGGKMVGVEMQTITGSNTYTMSKLTRKTGCTYKAFLVNSTTYAPLCAADDF